MNLHLSPQVVVVCSSEGTAQAELQLLQEIEKTLKESAVPHVMVYATQPFRADPSPTRRSLLAAKQQPQFVCDATCQTQVPSYVTCICYKLYRRRQGCHGIGPYLEYITGQQRPQKFLHVSL